MSETKKMRMHIQALNKEHESRQRILEELKKKGISLDQEETLRLALFGWMKDYSELKLIQAF